MISNRSSSTQPLFGGVILLALILPVLLVGCSTGGLAAVSGKVTYKGKPVPGGTLIFSPIASGEDQNPGKPAAATVQKDGAYTVGTSGTSDGARIGRHRVSYTPPPLDVPEEKLHDPKFNPPPSPYANLVPKTQEVEVKSGRNNIDIELVPKSGRPFGK